MTQQTELETTGKTSVADWLNSDKLKGQIAQALPKHLTPDRFMRVLAASMQKTPKLMQCSKTSLFEAMITCSQLGIEPDGRRAHLIPYGNTCQLIIDYKGIAELVMRSGLVSNIHADIVCDNDVFDYDAGEIKAHKVNFREPRGEVYAVYARCRFKDGSEKCDVMTKDEVEAIRKRSKAGNSGPWQTDWNEMAKKTVFRRLSKWLPLSSEVRDALEKDDQQFDFGNEGRSMRPAIKVESPQILDGEGSEG